MDPATDKWPEAAEGTPMAETGEPQTDPRQPRTGEPQTDPRQPWHPDDAAAIRGPADRTGGGAHGHQSGADTQAGLHAEPRPAGDDLWAPPWLRLRGDGGPGRADNDAAGAYGRRGFRPSDPHAGMTHEPLAAPAAEPQALMDEPLAPLPPLGGAAPPRERPFPPQTRQPGAATPPHGNFAPPAPPQVPDSPSWQEIPSAPDGPLAEPPQGPTGLAGLFPAAEPEFDGFGPAGQAPVHDTGGVPVAMGPPDYVFGPPPGAEAPGAGGLDDAEGLDAEGLDAEGLDAEGLDAEGLDAEGLDAEGLDAELPSAQTPGGMGATDMAVEPPGSELGGAGRPDTRIPDTGFPGAELPGTAMPDVGRPHRWAIDVPPYPDPWGPSRAQQQAPGFTAGSPPEAGTPGFAMDQPTPPADQAPPTLTTGPPPWIDTPPTDQDGISGHQEPPRFGTEPPPWLDTALTDQDGLNDLSSQGGQGGQPEGSWFTTGRPTWQDSSAMGPPVGSQLYQPPRRIMPNGTGAVPGIQPPAGPHPRAIPWPTPQAGPGAGFPDQPPLATGGQAPQRRPRGGKILAIGAGITALVVAAAAVAVLYRHTSAKHTTSATAPPSATSSVAPQLRLTSKINNVATDPKPITRAEIFPNRSLSVRSRQFARVAATVNRNCALTARGSFARALKADKCERVVRATFVDSSKRFVITAGVAALPTKTLAKRANRAKRLKRNIWFAGLDGPRQSGAQSISTTGGYAYGVVDGRYIIFAYATYTNGRTPTGNGPQDHIAAALSCAFAML